MWYSATRWRVTRNARQQDDKRQQDGDALTGWRQATTSDDKTTTGQDAPTVKTGWRADDGGRRSRADVGGLAIVFIPHKDNRKRQPQATTRNGRADGLTGKEKIIHADGRISELTGGYFGASRQRYPPRVTLTKKHTYRVRCGMHKQSSVNLYTLMQ